ncbi:MAG: ABC transporter ATP-binding protein [Leptothrix sp. (in: b-proteobacteria)]
MARAGDDSGLDTAVDPALAAAFAPTRVEGDATEQAADLSVEGLVKQYATPTGVQRAVDGLNLGVARGSFFSILGPSGCGKTTLLRMIAGFIEPDAGDIFIGGRSMRGVAPNRRPVNMVFQHLALFPMMSVGDNVGYGLARRGLAKAVIRVRVGEMLERVGLAGAQDKRPDQLSGGQKQRVAIARSLVLEPTLLLLDEPLGALDLKLREHMKIELKQLQAEFGTTFVYITHDQSEALVLSDHVAVMNAGRFEQVGTPQSLYYSPASAFVAGFVGANNRLDARVLRVETDTEGHARVEALSADGLRLWARAAGTQRVAVGDAVQCFVRPEAMTLARGEPAALALGADAVRLSGQVSSLLFDGANSAVLLRESASGSELRIALPQTGQFADLHVGEAVSFGFEPARALCFAAP